MAAVDYMQYLWMAYGVVVAGFYFTKTKHTNDSFFTQLLTWLLFALGSHAVTGCTTLLQLDGFSICAHRSSARQFSTFCRRRIA